MDRDRYSDMDRYSPRHRGRSDYSSSRSRSSSSATPSPRNRRSASVSPILIPRRRLGSPYSPPARRSTARGTRPRLRASPPDYIMPHHDLPSPYLSTESSPRSDSDSDSSAYFYEEDSPSHSRRHSLQSPSNRRAAYASPPPPILKPVRAVSSRSQEGFRVPRAHVSPHRPVSPPLGMSIPRGGGARDRSSPRRASASVANLPRARRTSSPPRELSPRKNSFDPNSAFGRQLAIEMARAGYSPDIVYTFSSYGSGDAAAVDVPPPPPSSNVAPYHAHSLPAAISTSSSSPRHRPRMRRGANAVSPRHADASDERASLRSHRGQPAAELLTSHSHPFYRQQPESSDSTMPRGRRFTFSQASDVSHRTISVSRRSAVSPDRSRSLRRHASTRSLEPHPMDRQASARSLGPRSLSRQGSARMRSPERHSLSRQASVRSLESVEPHSMSRQASRRSLESHSMRMSRQASARSLLPPNPPRSLSRQGSSRSVQSQDSDFTLRGAAIAAVSPTSTDAPAGSSRDKVRRLSMQPTDISEDNPIMGKRTKRSVTAVPQSDDLDKGVDRAKQVNSHSNANRQAGHSRRATGNIKSLEEERQATKRALTTRGGSLSRESAVSARFRARELDAASEYNATDISMLPAADESIQAAPYARQRVMPLEGRRASKLSEALAAKDDEARRRSTTSVATISEDAIDEGDDDLFALSPLDAMKFVDLVMMNRSRSKSAGVGAAARNERTRSASVTPRPKQLATIRKQSATSKTRRHSSHRTGRRTRGEDADADAGMSDGDADADGSSRRSSQQLLPPSPRLSRKTSRSLSPTKPRRGRDVPARDMTLPVFSLSDSEAAVKADMPLTLRTALKDIPTAQFCQYCGIRRKEIDGELASHCYSCNHAFEASSVKTVTVMKTEIKRLREKAQSKTLRSQFLAEDLKMVKKEYLDQRSQLVRLTQVLRRTMGTTKTKA